MKIRYGIIGCGRISPNHIQAAIDNNIDIVAMCDLKLENIEDKILKFDLSNKINKYQDYTKMIREENLDLIAICTESGKHGGIAIDCINNDINLIIEKPITLSLDEADEIIRLSTERNVKVSSCHQNRFNKAIVKIKDAVDKQRFGKLFYGTAHIRWNRNFEYYNRAPWRGTWEQDGGALMNQCIHNIDLLRWMMGGSVSEVIAVADNQNHNYLEAEDLGLAIIKFANGSYGLVEGTTNIYPENLEETLYIFGEKGTVKAGGKSVNEIHEWKFADFLDDPKEVKKLFSETPPNVYGFGHTSLYKDVIESITEDRCPKVTAKDGRDALELVLGIYLAAKEKQNIKFPLSGLRTLDFKDMYKK